MITINNFNIVYSIAKLALHKVFEIYNVNNSNSNSIDFFDENNTYQELLKYIILENNVQNYVINKLFLIERELDINIYNNIITNEEFDMNEILDLCFENFEWIFVKEKNNINNLLVQYTKDLNNNNSNSSSSSK